jgi:hypothetical protein
MTRRGFHTLLYHMHCYCVDDCATELPAMHGVVVWHVVLAGWMGVGKCVLMQHDAQGAEKGATALNVAVVHDECRGLLRH